MEEFGICGLSVIPVRSEPSERSEMVTQLLFGDLVAINYKSGNWLNIRIIYDNYEGWIDDKMILPLSGTEFEQINGLQTAYTTEIVDVMKEVTTGALFPVLLGSSIRETGNKTLKAGKLEFFFEGRKTKPGTIPAGRDIIETAVTYLNAPYLWGGKTPFGIDCSGFTQQVFKICGVKLLRDASLQVTQGETVNFISEARAGDLAFFDNEEGKIIHTGIIMNDGNIIHASGKVRIDKIDHQGIYNEDTRNYTHKLRVIKRII